MTVSFPFSILVPFRSSTRPFAGAICALALAVAAAPTTASAADARPLDQCVGQKLSSSADVCRGALSAWSKWTRQKNRDGAGRRERVEEATAAFATAWGDAETAAGDDGPGCATATGSSDGVAEVAAAAVKQIAKKIAKNLDRGDKGERVCGSRVLRAASSLCADLLNDEGQHLVGRYDDRLRQGLETARTASLDSFTEEWLEIKADCKPGVSRGKVADLVEELARKVVTTATVSPSVSDGWEKITPPAEVDFEGQTLDPKCWDGAEYSFFVHRGTTNKLVMYYQGGGACWSALTCGGLDGITGPTFKRTVGDGDNPANFSSGFADFSNPKNPFKDWNMVMVPYCTGDIHWGDAEVDYEIDLGDEEPRVTSVAHKGFVNAQVAEKYAREHFVHPEQVFVAGSSAGAYGAVINSLYLQERAYPSADFAVLGDAGNGVITQEFLEDNLATWGIEDNLPSWIPALAVPLEELDATDLYTQSALAYPQNRFATYTSAYDGGNGGQTGFLQIMRNPNNAINWARWWDSSCRWNREMTALNAHTQAEAPNFRSYVGTGSAHTMWGRDKVYDDTTSNVPTVRDWLKSMLKGKDNWVSVECDDCGVVLEGDPLPFLEPHRPFDLEAGRIDCPVPD